MGAMLPAEGQQKATKGDAIEQKAEQAFCRTGAEVMEGMRYHDQVEIEQTTIGGGKVLSGVDIDC